MNRTIRFFGSGSDARRYSWLCDAVASGAEIVTVNNRLARELRRAFDEQQLARGLLSWHTPRILPWTAWLNSVLDRCDTASHTPLCIPPRAAALLWERLLREHAQERLLNPDNLVRQAQQTWQRLQDWCVPVADLQRHASSDDERLFAGIAVAYQRHLDANSWIDSALLAACVTGLIVSGRIEAPARVVHAGFDRLTPAAEGLLNALRGIGAAVSEAPGAGWTSTVLALSCTDGDAELRAAGLWARRLLQADAGATVAIVCPGLEQDATRAARLVREGLAPGWQYAGGRRETAVNVSYGRRLAEYPLVAVALLWLSWACRGLPARDVSLLLRTPFAGSANTDGRCRLEMRLRRMPDRNWRPGNLAAALRGAEQSADALDWLQRVERVAAMESARGAFESPAVWAGRIDQLLQELGWPGEKALDTGEFQLANRWRDLLNELSRLDVVQPRIDLAEAVARLSSFAADTIYQPETERGMVQLLGTLEAAGLEFDNLWVCHLAAQEWPPSAHPLPLVSRALQRKFRMPDATPKDTLDFSRRVLERLAGAATNVTFSWPLTDQDLELDASPLLARFVLRHGGQGEDPGWHAASLHGSAAPELVPGDDAPAVRPREKVGGGATTVQRQVTEPFSAFAYGRLGVRDLQHIEAGLPANARGNIIHRALHHLFTDKPSTRDIEAWSTGVDDRIERAVDVALARHSRFADGVLLRLLAIERRRSRELLLRFVEAEMQRQEFKVLSVEESVGFLKHGVELDLRVDRIDRLADGTLLIIDYKTGAAKTLLTKDGDPKELQLVVYASAIDAEIGGLVLINIDSRGIVYRGAGGSVEWDRLPPELWPARLGGWKKIVDDALAQLAAGDVRLNTAQTALESRPLNVLSRVEEIKRGR
jgi:probable DNA repair protein